MKKNFLKVAALLIAAMLMVVSCTQEVAPVNNGLVEATIGLAYGKDVTVTHGKDAEITYMYKLTPMWSNLENGAPAYGGTDVFVNLFEGTKKIADTSLGTVTQYVTPGYWLIEVEGLVGNVAVLKGSTKAYFNSTGSTATVYVSPVSSESKGKMTINLVMEDLDSADAANDTASKIYYLLDGADDISANRVYLTKGTAVSGSAAHNYSVIRETTENKDEGIVSGYHTITLKVDKYTGGVTKSFLMIPGNDVTISGSIYPSQFKKSESTITVVSLGSKTLTAAGEQFTENNNTPVKVTTKSVSVSIEAFTAPFTQQEVSSLGYTGVTGITYSWYLDGVKKGIDTSTSSTSIDLPVDTNSTVIPGDYTISCVAKFTYTDAEGVCHTIYGDSAYAGKVRVEATGNKVLSLIHI